MYIFPCILNYLVILKFVLLDSDNIETIFQTVYQVGQNIPDDRGFSNAIQHWNNLNIFVLTSVFVNPLLDIS